jgi:hypothetical protein
MNLDQNLAIVGEEGVRKGSVMRRALFMDGATSM